ncbi:hypothetical protein IFM89_011504 [Coptis chinensis]|uniref:Uncharacterized protein n=1 Tax=Coptis chinensis TaxID=261450 RepID=A0A835LZY1_9MAGN|nr:hypothetical protein IFM89_011504 [Coptis chinensis]
MMATVATSTITHPGAAPKQHLDEDVARTMHTMFCIMCALGLDISSTVRNGIWVSSVQVYSLKPSHKGGKSMDCSATDIRVRLCKSLEFDNPERPECNNLLSVYQIITGRTKEVVGGEWSPKRERGYDFNNKEVVEVDEILEGTFSLKVRCRFVMSQPWCMLSSSYGAVDYGLTDDIEMEVEDEVTQECQDMNWGSFKPLLADALVQHLHPIQVRYEEIISDSAYLDRVLVEGATKASNIADATLNNVYQAMGFLPR